MDKRRKKILSASGFVKSVKIFPTFAGLLERRSSVSGSHGFAPKQERWAESGKGKMGEWLKPTVC